jgi:hypothetical protein
MQWYALALCACFTACQARYANNDLELLTQYAAKEYCSCLFVMKQTRSYCNAWTAASPNVATVRVNTQKKTVQAQAFIMWGAKAHYDQEAFGCVAD